MEAEPRPIADGADEWITKMKQSIQESERIRQERLQRPVIDSYDYRQYYASSCGPCDLPVPTVACMECGNERPIPPRKDGTYADSPVCEECRPVLIARHNAAKYTGLLAASDIPARLVREAQSCPPYSFLPGLVEAAKAGRGVLLFGPTGTGKSVALAQIALALMREGTAVRYRTEKDIAHDMRPKDFSEDDRDRLRHGYHNDPCLIIDDLGRVASAYAVEVIEDIIDARYGWDRLTLCATNLLPADMTAGQYGRIVSRLYGAGEVRGVGGDDKRRGKKGGKP